MYCDMQFIAVLELSWVKMSNISHFFSTPINLHSKYKLEFTNLSIFRGIFIKSTDFIHKYEPVFSIKLS